MGRKEKNKISKLRDTPVWQNIFSQLYCDAQNRWHIEGLPDTCSQRIIQQGILEKGAVCLYKKDGAYICLPATPTDGVTMYSENGKCRVYGANGFTEEVSLVLPGSDEAPILEQTSTHLKHQKPTGALIYEREGPLYSSVPAIPFINTVRYYADILADLLIKTQIAAKYAAIGHIFTADESIAQQVEATIRKIYDENEEHVVSTGFLDPSKVNALTFSANPTSIQSLTSAYEWFMSQYKIACGTAAQSNLDKKGENLISAEVHAGDEYAEMQSQHSIDCLQRRLDIANKTFGLNMKAVKGGESYEPDDDIQDYEDGNGGVPDDYSGGSAGDDQ